MPIAKVDRENNAHNDVYNDLIRRIDAELASWKPGEVVYIDVEDVDADIRSEVASLYTELGWTVTSEYCPPDYDDLWFS